MKNEHLRDNLIEIFCKEYQSIWLIDCVTQQMEAFYADVDSSIPESIETVTSMENYESARLWYIENNVVEHHRKRLLAQTQFDNLLKKTESGNTYFVEYRRISDGVINYNQLCFDRINDDEGNIQYLMMGFRNIDIRKKAELDDITGLLSRHIFFNKAEELLNNYPDEQFDIIISDIVDFKKINETYGIEVADEILRWIGKYLAPLNNDKRIVGRYGGDQIAIMGSHDEISYCISDEFHSNYINSEKKNGLPNIITKFGIYENIRHDRSIISSCDRAHMALSSIKRHYYKDLAFYDDKLKEQLDKQRRIENSMYESLNNGDFKVYYQPKHDAVSGKLVGAEALIRWIHPVYGFMSPADFIPLFEQNGFIIENDMYVWRKTCENIKRWQEKNIKTVPISINASKITMNSNSLIEDIQVPIKEYGISPENLHIEITETMMANDIDKLVSKLSQIRALGHEIELDDFGSGYSSINILSTLPLDVVKLDMSFMQHFGDEKKAKVLEACVHLAKELGFKTVSEGVELKEQKEVLGDLGVDMIQGYYYSKPLPEEEFEKYMIDNI